MAPSDGGDSDLLNNCNINCAAIIRLFLKGCEWESRRRGKWGCETLRKKLADVFNLTFQHHEYGSERSRSFTELWPKENKTIKKMLKSFVLT